MKYFTPSPKISELGVSEEDSCANFLPERLADVGPVLEIQDRDLLYCNGYRIYSDIYSCNEFIGGPIVSSAQRDGPHAADTTQLKEVAGGEIEQTLSDIQWKDPRRGDASTIGSWIRDE